MVALAVIAPNRVGTYDHDSGAVDGRFLSAGYAKEHCVQHNHVDNVGDLER